jgi:methylmalonyl-CoA/ethylmalonyl-CoA epimerase
MINQIDFFGKEARFHHIGMAVKSIRGLCSECQIFKDETQNVHVAFITLNGIQIELIEPVNEISPVFQSLRKGIKLLHLCYEVPDLEKAIKESRKDGFHCISKPVPATAFDNRKIVWLYSREWGLIELVEK